MKIEGVPEGWRLVRIGKPKAGEYYIENHGEACEAKPTTPTVLHWVFPIIEKIEKPKRYRPFANAAEFAPFRDRWLMHPSEPDKRFAPADYNNEGVWGVGGRMYDYKRLFESGTLFDDGTPFGIEVTE